MNLEEIFNEVSIQMKSDLAKAQNSFPHSGLKGDANEETVKKFLRQYLPKALDITTGTLVDSKGNQSRQLDIIICDSAKTPIFFQSGDNRVIPAECAYAVIEVKAYLDKTELGNSYKNMLSVKALEKMAYFYQKGIMVTTQTLYGREWNYWPIQYFVFAFDSPGLDSVLTNLNTYQNENEIHKRIDSICILEKGVIMNKSPDGMFSALPTPGSYAAGSLTSKPLLLFYTLISVILNQTRMESFNLMPYILKGKIHF
jgi:hypothetical protein